MERGVRFEWDPDKDRANREKHGISFEEASELLESVNDFLEIYDEAHAGDEERFIAIGPIRNRMVVVYYTERADDVIRIISARRATKNEVRLFQKCFEGDP